VHVAQVGFYLDPYDRGPRELLRAWPSIVEVAEAAATAVAKVSVLQACKQEEDFAVHGVDYHFVARPDDARPWARARAGAERLIERLATLRPDAVHIHGLGFPGPVSQLARRMPGVPILLQDHADRPPTFWHRRSWRKAATQAAGIALCSRDQLRPFAAAGVLPENLPVFEIPECTSRFRPADRDSARQTTGLHGEPAVLWVGHLDANKDPLTVLEALRRTAEALPRLELWCVYKSAALLPQIERQLKASPDLQRRVHLLGAVPHERVEVLMNAADLYVSASHREGSGYALIEALACGLPAIVTDIPSFRALTAQGRVGLLWSAGDPAALAARLIQGAGLLRAQHRVEVRAHFARELSERAVGQKLADTYAQLMSHAAK